MTTPTPNTADVSQASSGSMPEIGPAGISISSVFEGASSGLSLVEERIRSRLISDAGLLEKIPAYLLEQGGKRIRPTLCLLIARLFRMEQPSQELIDVSAGIELIHMATLLHDDIIDQSPKRRHKRSAYVEFGMMPSLLAGDFLLVRAFGLCALLDDFVITRTERACVELTEGEILEGTIDAESSLNLDHYLDVVGKKTASLFDLATTVGAHLSQSSADVTAQLGRFGRFAGIAFQMVDDILDITADEDLLGKPAGTDLKQRTPSLVNILWLESKDPKALEFFAKESISIEEAKIAADYICTTDIVEQCQNLAEEYAKKASDELLNLDAKSIDESTRQQLLLIVSYTLSRCL